MDNERQRSAELLRTGYLVCADTNTGVAPVTTVNAIYYNSQLNSWACEVRVRLRVVKSVPTAPHIADGPSDGCVVGARRHLQIARGVETRRRIRTGCVVIAAHVAATDAAEACGIESVAPR